MKLVGDAITQAEDEYDACRERFDSYGRAQARQSSLGGGEPLTGTADLTAMDSPVGIAQVSGGVGQRRAEQTRYEAAT